MVLNEGNDILLTILIVYFPAQYFSHILLVFLVGVLQFRPIVGAYFVPQRLGFSISSIFVSCS